MGIVDGDITTTGLFTGIWLFTVNETGIDAGIIELILFIFEAWVWAWGCTVLTKAIAYGLTALI